MVTAAYLSRAGLDVLVLERRDILGGAAVTEEVIPGFKFSRASYLAGLLRPKIVEELSLEERGLKYLIRDPSSFTPSRDPGAPSLMLGSDMERTCASIAQFSPADARAYPAYEELLGKVRDVLRPLLDAPPPNPFQGRFRERRQSLQTMAELTSGALRHKEILPELYDILTAPASQILDKWFESEMLKTTLACDAVIGTMTSPKNVGSGYVLLHHVLGEAAGRQGVWAYVEGGMGAVSDAIAKAASEAGAELRTGCAVSEIVLDSKGRAKGVRLAGGEVFTARRAVVSNLTPHQTVMHLLNEDAYGKDGASARVREKKQRLADYRRHIRGADYTCGAFKINCALDSLPNFACLPNDESGLPGPQHRGTIHFENRMCEIERASVEASLGIPATCPVIEMTIPSSLDSTIAPPGKHVAQLFVQFAPYDVDPVEGSWHDPRFKNAFVNRVLSIVDEFAPGFQDSIIGLDALSPLDLENIFGLHKGNIFHGALGLNQIGWARPAPGWSSHRTPIDSLYLCSAGNHPGGGVSGAPGRNCAAILLSDMGIGI
eukprot:CAMPEP_0184498816 /NCGR_PEP_ID=MMETSP0113_2-20130426/39916_1 /TAXON_ID=91329 /ORGANISM="Norrisiella sphaerica, Strain BC52" /LENGTH=545 /DNA_ID=CAMNT_0026886479 /DNA_START=274 /DNA_END=1911 /DNA_ORIENTATION=-